MLVKNQLQQVCCVIFTIQLTISVNIKMTAKAIPKERACFISRRRVIRKNILAMTKMNPPGFASKLSAKSPRSKWIRLRCRPQAGQSHPVNHLNGHGRRCDSTLFKDSDHHVGMHQQLNDVMEIPVKRFHSDLMKESATFRFQFIVRTLRIIF